MAGETSAETMRHSTWGIRSEGRAPDTLPNLLPIVSTGRSKSCTAAVVTRMATSEPGTRCVTRGQRNTIAMVAMPITAATGVIDPACSE